MRLRGPTSMRAGGCRRLLVASVALAAMLVVAACGGAGDYNDAVGVAAPPGTEVVAVASASPSPVTPTTVVANSAAFCQDVERLQALLPSVLQPGQESATLNQVEALLSRMEANAPAGIRPAVAQVRQTEDQLIQDLTANPPDFADIGRTYRNPAFQQALQQLGLYAVSQC